jgi:hypothetical protein
MTTTTEMTIPGDGTWTQVSTGSQSVTIQLQSRGPVRIRIQETAPLAASTFGILLDADLESVFAGNALAATDNAYVRSISGKDEALVVMKT